MKVILQKVIRAGLKTPGLEKLFWRYVPRVRQLSTWFASAKRFMTTYDLDIKIWVSFVDFIESQIYWQGVQEGDRGEIELLKSKLKPDFIFLDVGANIGVFAMLAAKRLTSGRVYAFEPSQAHCDKFAMNVQLNDFKNIILNQCALSNKKTERKLFFPKSSNTGMASLYNIHSKMDVVLEEKIHTITLDEYFFGNRIERLDAIKIDVEGSELDVLEGGRLVIERFRPQVFMEVNQEHLSHASRTLGELTDFWGSLNYSIFRIENNAGLTRILRSDEFNAHQNIYCCPEEHNG